MTQRQNLKVLVEITIAMLNFKQFNNDTALTKNGIFQLTESITHIEDLSPEEFLDAVKNIAYNIATEKLDGANQVVGFDNDGRFYTSREMKGGERTYSVGPARRAADNGFRASHAVLEKMQAKLKEVLQAGDAVEIELLFGRQPNAIVYGSNYIAFLRMVPGDNQEHPNQSKIRKLNTVLKDQTVHISLPIITSSDGLNIAIQDTDLTFKFASTAVIDNFEFHKVNLKYELTSFEQWLKQNPGSSFKTKKAFAEAAAKFMLPIKEKLLDQVVRKIKPALRDTEVAPHEDFGIEGIVVLDPKTGKQFKLVDKSVFMLINQFNHTIRSQIKQTSNFNHEAYAHLYKAFNASLGVEGRSIYDKMLETIAQVIGIPELGKYTMVTRTLKKYPSLKSFVDHWPDLSNVKPGVSKAVSAGLAQLEKGRQKFISNWKNYALHLNNGREIKYTEEIYNRTLLFFAETHKEMKEILEMVNSASSNAEIANAVFGKQLKAIANQ